MVSAGNVATAGIFTLLAVLLVLQLTKEPRTAAPSARPPVPSAAGPAGDAGTAPPMRAVILPPPPEFRATPRTPPAVAAPTPAPAPAISSPAPPPPAPRPAPPAASETPKPRPPSVAAPAPAAPAPVASAPAASVSPAPAPTASRATASAPTGAGAAGLRIDPAEASAVLSEGRVLLRLLEHGRGPAIEITWPDDEAGANGLYRLLEQCYGMRIALLDAEGRLWGSDVATPRGGAIDLDRFSGFVREPKGFAPPEESRRAAALRAQYAGAQTARVVRVFPRAVDAALVGGLRQLLGPRYDSAQTIRAAYARDGAALAIDAIVVDGVPMRGRISFVPARDEPCGQGS